jgi:hypothetical protein
MSPCPKPVLGLERLTPSSGRSTMSGARQAVLLSPSPTRTGPAGLVGTVSGGWSLSARFHSSALRRRMIRLRKSIPLDRCRECGNGVTTLARLGMRDDHERTRGVMGALLADGPEEEPDESAVTARAETSRSASRAASRSTTAGRPSTARSSTSTPSCACEATEISLSRSRSASSLSASYASSVATDTC